MDNKKLKNAKEALFKIFITEWRVACEGNYADKAII